MSDTTKVLIADDEQECIDFVREALADTPYEVLAARDGAEALQLAREHRPQLVILDVQMPKHSGFDVFREMRSDKDLAAAVVIMLTGITDRTGMKFSEKEMGEYMGSEPEAYLDKPIEPVVLKQTVNRLIKRTAPGA